MFFNIKELQYHAKPDRTDPLFARKLQEVLGGQFGEITAESQGRLQVARLYEMTNDRGVKDMLSWLLARDTMHQNQWIAAIRELEEKEGVVVPNTFPKELEKQDVAYVLFNFSRGNESAEGRWAHGPSMDGQGTFQYVQHSQPLAPAPKLPPAPPYIFDTSPELRKGNSAEAPPLMP